MKILDKFINAYEYNMHKIQEHLDNNKDVIITNRYNSNKWIFFFIDNINNSMSLRMIGQPFVIVSKVNKKILFSYFDGDIFTSGKNIKEIKEIAEKEIKSEPIIIDTNNLPKDLYTLFND